MTLWSLFLIKVYTSQKDDVLQRGYAMYRIRELMKKLLCLKAQGEVLLTYFRDFDPGSLDIQSYKRS